MGGWQVAFDKQPTPIVILSHNLRIVKTNQACRQIFEECDDLVDKHVGQLAISWRDGDESTLQDLLAQDVEEWRSNLEQLQQDSAPAYLRLAVEIRKHHDSNLFTASMLVSDFDIEHDSFRMLSFENIKESSSIPFLHLQASPEGHVPVENKGSAPLDKAVSHSGAYTQSGKSSLELKFSQLCDAIYHNENRHGFLLAADETFCYPNYTASKTATAVEIDDIELFFAEFDVWEPDFSRKLTFSELPSIWLNKHRTKFRNQRWGLREEGRDLIIETSGEPLYDPKTGEYLGGVVWVSTLGEHNEVMANELRYSLSDFKNICDRLPHLLWTVDATGMADYFSKSWYDFTGFSEEQSRGMGFTEVIDPIDMQGIWDDFLRATKTKTEVNREAKYRRHDGQWRWMNVRAKPLIDGNGQVLKWYGTSTEVNSLVRERLDAEKKKDEMRQMLSLTDVGLFEVESGWLRVLEGRMGWLLNQEMVMPMIDLDREPESGISAVAQHLREILKGSSRSVSFEVQIRSRWYKFRIISETGSDREGELSQKVLGCSVDVTEQRGRAVLEAENARLVHEATLEVEKSRLKTAFLAHMSHEIRTPIAGIIGTADMLIDTTHDDEQREGLGNIHFSAQNLLTIVNDILDLSKIEAGQMQFEKISFNIHALIAQTTKLFLPTARSKFLELTYDCNGSEELEMTGDSGRVRQILTNLVSNAIKFTAKGSVTLSTKIVGMSIQCVVQDTGEGIDAVTMQMLFKPFVQGDASTARRHGGTGLGLTISRNLAQMMGGTLMLESYALQGTKAILTLPRKSIVTDATIALGADSEKPLPFEKSPPIQRTFSSPATIDLKNIQQPTVPQGNAQPLVLIVEDNAINQKVAINLVGKLGYATRAVWNGQEALDYLETSISPSCNGQEASESKDRTGLPSLILMDCQMPLLDGYEATRMLRTDIRYWAFKTVPVVALTASAIQGDQERCRAAGMDDYLSKPVNKGLLKSMLKKWIPDGPS